VDSDCGLERFHGVKEALRAHADVLDYQIVAFPQAGIVSEEGVRQLLDAALREGADLVGGLDPLLYDRDPISHLRSEEHTSELRSRFDLVCRLLLEKKNQRHQ